MCGGSAVCCSGCGSSGTPEAGWTYSFVGWRCVCCAFRSWMPLPTFDADLSTDSQATAGLPLCGAVCRPHRSECTEGVSVALSLTRGGPRGTLTTALEDQGVVLLSTGGKDGRFRIWPG